jgi:Lon protease-like protein
MSGATRRFETESLPGTLPIFPLTGALLLPRARLPLNIFEPRYLAMVEDALGRGRVIGMVQPKATHPDPVPDGVPLYDIGCVGRITSFAETDDSRFLITLLGIGRFRIAKELEMTKGYRRVVPDFTPFVRDRENDDGAARDRKRLIRAVRGFFGLKGIDGDWSAINEASDEALVTSLAMICPFEPREKQALLECVGVAERSELLTALMEMAVHEAEATARAAKH